MLRLLFGEVKSQSGGRVNVFLPGFEEDVAAEVLALCGGQGKVQTWASFMPGDKVAVLMDDEHQEDAVLLGGIWPDSGTPASAESGQVAIRADKVSIFKNSVDDMSAASRDDLIQGELAGIKSALDVVVKAFDVHTHPAPAGATSAPTTLITDHGYSVGDTKSEIVSIQ